MNDRQVKSLLKAGEVGKYSIGNGLYFRISKEKTGFFIFRYTFNKKRREITIGTYGDMTLAKARMKVSELALGVSEGIDPIAEKARTDSQEILTVNDLAQDWLKTISKKLKNPQIPKRVYEKDIAPKIGQLSLKRVSPRDIRSVITSINESGRPTIANDALLHCKQIFKHGIKLDVCLHNPADAFSLEDAGGAEQSRKRALSLDELKSVFSCFRANKDAFTRDNYLAVSLLLLLMVRKGELIKAKWSEVDLENKTWKIPEDVSKTGIEIIIPLSDLACELFTELKFRSCGSEYVLPNRRASKRFGHISMDTMNHAISKMFKLNKLSVEHFTVHDLRRTSRSLLSSLKVPSHICERCLNHKLRGVEGIYDRYDYFDERKEALNKLSALLEGVVKPQEG